MAKRYHKGRNMVRFQDLINQKKRQCRFCSTNTKWIDYKDPALLRGFVSMQAKMYPPRKTGTCAKHQRMLAKSIKRARYMALMPFTINETSTFTH